MLENNTENIPADEVEDNVANKTADESLTETSKTETELEEPQGDTDEKENDAPVDTTAPSSIETKKVDYASSSLEELIKEFQKLLKVEPVYQTKNQVEEIKKNFNVKFGTLLQEKKKAFIDEGGNEVDFHYNNPLKSQYNDLLFEYKVKRDRYYKQQESLQKDNLSKRLALIEELKELIDTADAATMYNSFRSLQDRWRAVGKIPHSKYNDVWRTYHHHVERFYGLLHLNKDFRELDFKHNLEEKMKLVEKAEALVLEGDANRAFKELQELHRLWKEDIGPVDREHREEVWNRFSEATKKIHDKRHEAQREQESKYEENFIKKQAAIDAIKQLLATEISSHSEWQRKIRELEALRQDFFKIGRVPRSKNNSTWQSFKEATRDFNRAKNTFYKSVKKKQQDNLNQKLALVEKAESLKDSEDWDATTPVMKQIQIDWKSIGHVPKKYSDEIWKRFKDACNYYFDRLHGVQDEANKEQIAVFNKKKALLENLRSQADKDEALTLEVIQSYNNDWKNLGSVPSNMRHIESKFNKVLDRLYGKLDMDKGEIAFLKFKNIVDGYLSGQQFKKLKDEQYFVRKKVDEVTREIKQLENNISYISSDSDDNPLIKSVQKNIDNFADELKTWKNKLDYISKLDY